MLVIAERGILMKRKNIFTILVAAVMSVFAFKVVSNRRRKKNLRK